MLRLVYGPWVYPAKKYPIIYVNIETLQWSDVKESNGDFAGWLCHVLVFNNQKQFTYMAYFYFFTVLKRIF